MLHLEDSASPQTEPSCVHRLAFNWCWRKPKLTSIYINNRLHLGRKYARIFVRGHYLFREANSFEEQMMSFEEQMMPKDKYPSIFSPQMEAIVVIMIQIFFATRAVSKIGEYFRIFPSFSWEIFGHVTCLDQSRTGENI